MTNLRNTIKAGALALLVSGCAVDVNNSNGQAVVVGKESDAYIVQLDDSSFKRLYGPLTDTSKYQIGDALNQTDINYITEGKQNKMKGGQ